MRIATLQDVLNFRDQKAQIQRQLLDSDHDGLVLSFGLNIPGEEKTSPVFWEVFQEGRSCIERFLETDDVVIKKKVQLEEAGGYAVIYLLSADPYLIKQSAVRLEEEHLLGRLFDVDIVLQDGSMITRSEVGAKPRACLICGQDAKACARSRKHEVSELKKIIERMIEFWRRQDDSRRKTF